MTNRSTRAGAGLVRCLLLVCAILLESTGAPTEEEASPPPPPPRPIPDVFNEIKEAGNRAHPDLFDEIARHGSKDALKVLKKCERLVDAAWTRQRLYLSLHGFSDTAKLAEDAANWLEDRCRSDHTRTRYPAALAMPGLGLHAAAPAARLCRSSDDEWVPSIVVPCVLDRLEAEGRHKDLEMVIDHYDARQYGSPDRLREVLSEQTGRKARRAMRACFDRREGSAETKRVVVDVLVALDDEDELAVLHERMLNPDHAPTAHIIARLAETDYCDHADDLEALAASKNSHIAAEAYLGLAALADARSEVLQRLFALAKHERYDRRHVAILGVKKLVERGRLGTFRTEAMAVVSMLLTDPVSYVRDTALEIVQLDRSPDHVPELIGALDTDDLDVRKAIEMALILLTGVDHGGSPGRWTKWWEDEGKDLPLPEFEVAKERRNERERSKNRARRTEFYGLTVKGDGVCLLLDASGSMEEMNEWEETRLDIAKQQTIGALERLPDGTAFNVVFFGTVVSAWRDKMAVLDDATREEAIAFIEAQDYLGGTALYDALEEVFEDPALANLYVLSDGAPMGGTTDDPEEILASVKRWNRKRRAIIHTISIGFRSELLASMAEKHGGLFREAD
ncbi:MAG: hypothetical protein AAGI22_17425 [Planctomycetota bacterium]